MMREIKYSVTSHGAFLCEIDEKNSETVTFKLDGEEDAILKIDEKTYKISHGVCFISPSELQDGTYVPELICDVGAFKLDTFAVNFGVIKLRIGERELANTSQRMLELYERLELAEEKNRKLWDAVFGTKLF